MEMSRSPSRDGDSSTAGSEQKREFLSRLLARMAHEIRNPLSSLDIHVQLAEEDLDRLAPQTLSKVAGRFEMIRGELRRLDTVVEQFLRLSRPSVLNLQTFRLSDVIDDVVGLMRAEAETRGIRLEVTHGDGLPPVRADRGQLIQALLNVLINALQAIDRNGCIEIHSAEAGSGLIQIEIRDTGPGVPAERKGAIFEPYFSTKRDGSGIGLWIAQQIALAHGGDIEVGDVPNGGATFTFRLKSQNGEGPRE